MTHAAKTEVEATPKLLIANRGEIGIRICKAARELSLPTVAIYSFEDRYSDHYQYADESYMLGEQGQFGPMEAPLCVERVLEIARACEATMVHPGYGMLSEDFKFARALERMGIDFIGPPSSVLERLGNKVSARQIAKDCGIAVVAGTEKPLSKSSDVFEFIERHGLPIIVKASNGGGGRGQRIISSVEQNPSQIVEEAQSEAEQAFGDSAVFLERFLSTPKHIEVQILGDKHGNVSRLWERDCTVQRKHQKIIEFAPAVSLSDSVRRKLHDAAVRLANHVRFESAATVEFLVENNDIFFIEVNSRIQVEHTVTESIFESDLVQAQIRIAQGTRLDVLGLGPNQADPNGMAIQCRITSEDPSKGFLPSMGTIQHINIPAGPGVRVDGYNLFAGARVTPHYDPLLFKCIVHAQDFAAACAKMDVALSETQIDGVKTNLCALRKILSDGRFLSHRFYTRLLDSDDDLLRPIQNSQSSDPSSQKLLAFFAETIVNGCLIPGQISDAAYLGSIVPRKLTHAGSMSLIDTSSPCQHGWRNIIVSSGPKEFARRVRAHPHVLLSDTTWRDAQQSLLATRVRTIDIANIARHTSHAYSNGYSLECWGGATFDVALRFLHEDPWARLFCAKRTISDAFTECGGLAYSALPDNILRRLAALAVKNGIDIIKVFDGLNDISNLKLATDACLQAGAVVETALLYSGDMLAPGSKYTLDYYLTLVDELVQTGAHVIAIKSMSGVMKPEAARKLVSTIRARYPDIPIHMHTHDAAGTGVATMIACAEAGADVIDGATDSLSGTTSQPPVSAIIASLEDKSFAPEIDLEHVRAIDSYWAQLRLLYSGFDAKLTGPDPDVYLHEIPGGQLTNLIFQSRELGLSTKWKESKDAFVVTNPILGDIFMVNRNLDEDEFIPQVDSLDLPDSVLDFFQGLMGTPFHGFPEPLRTRVLRTVREKRLKLMHDNGCEITQEDFCSHVMFPDVFVAFLEFRNRFGNITWLPTQKVLTSPRLNETMELRKPSDGTESTESKDSHDCLQVTPLAVQPLSAEEEASSERSVFFLVDGRFRQATVTDSSVFSKTCRRKASPNNILEVGAPFGGTISKIEVVNSGSVVKGQKVLSLNAKKMVLNVSAPHNGHVEGLEVQAGDIVEQGDLLFEIL